MKCLLCSCILFLALTFSLPVSMVAQVKIGDSATVINVNSLLELESTDKGILLPRLNLTATNSSSPLSAFVEGMFVYNLNADGTDSTAVTPGLYYSDGTQWIKATSNIITDRTDDAWINDTGNVVVRLGVESNGIVPRSTGSDFVIKDDGKTGIGTDDPQATVHIWSEDTDEVLRVSDVDETDTPEIFFTGYLNPDGSYSLRKMEYDTLRRLINSQLPVPSRIIIDNVGAAAQTLGTGASSGTAVVMNLKNEVVNTNTDMFTFDSADNSITILDTGYYEVTAFIGFAAITSFEGDIVLSLVKDGVPIKRTIVSRTNNATSYSVGNGSGGSIISIDRYEAGSIIKLWAGRIGAEPVSTTSGSVNLSISRIDDGR